MTSSSEDQGQPEAITDDAWKIDVKDLVFGKKIGAGNFAKVIRGEYLGTPVAIKKVFEAEKDMQKYVKRELGLLKTLRHPNIVQFIGCCEKDGGVYIVTEFVPGGDLRTLLKRTNKHGAPKLSWRQRISMAQDIAAALLYLTSMNFVHRDLKTRNLLVQENGHLKICDFGLARKIDAKDEDKFMTICGTDEYMAPEVMLGDKYNEMADVYSFGMVCCELITHRDPPERQAHDGFQFHKQRFIKSVSPRCPKDFLDITLACVRYKADDRPHFREILPAVKEIVARIAQEAESAAAEKAAAEKLAAEKAAAEKVAADKVAADKVERDRLERRLDRRKNRERGGRNADEERIRRNSLGGMPSNGKEKKRDKDNKERLDRHRVSSLPRLRRDKDTSLRAGQKDKKRIEKDIKEKEISENDPKDKNSPKGRRRTDSAPPQKTKDKKDKKEKEKK